MSMPYDFELMKDGLRVGTHYWRSWVDPISIKAYKERCISALNEWHDAEGKEYGGTIKHTVPMMPEFDAIRFEWPKGNMVIVPIVGKNP